MHIKSTKEECISRAKNRPKEWIDYIENYFEKFQE
nr:MAG TPA: Regulatory subunit of type II PKA R-subunit [Caudoviricetes sp.]